MTLHPITFVFILKFNELEKIKVNKWNSLYSFKKAISIVFPVICVTKANKTGLNVFLQMGFRCTKIHSTKRTTQSKVFKIIKIKKTTQNSATVLLQSDSSRLRVFYFSKQNSNLLNNSKYAQS